MGHIEGDVEDRATTLAESAKDLLPILRRQARRAFVLELTGTPKAGKTTSVNTLRSFFKECGYRVHLLNERAADCPLPMKGHFFFNAWTTATMLSEVLETYDTDVDLLILDRGFFDALIWLELQRSREQVTEEERDVFTRFVLLDRWRSLVDLTVAVSVEPKLAMLRENNNLVVPRKGGVMNPDTLQQFNQALDTARQRSHVSGETPILERLEECLHQRVRDDLHLANRLKPDLAGMAWRPEENHVGVLYTVEVSDAVASSMKQKEFKRLARQATIQGDFREVAELRDPDTFELERWSKAYLESLP